VDVPLRCGRRLHSVTHPLAQSNNVAPSVTHPLAQSNNVAPANNLAHPNAVAHPLALPRAAGLLLRRRRRRAALPRGLILLGRSKRRPCMPNGRLFRPRRRHVHPLPGWVHLKHKRHRVRNPVRCGQPLCRHFDTDKLPQRRYIGAHV
jgi:hypothetical protein